MVDRPFQSILLTIPPPLIEKIIGELKMWSDLPLSLFGRAHLYKMASFSKLLYTLQNIHLLLKGSCIARLTSALLKFLWQCKRPRIAMQKLWLPRGERGLNVPNIKLYNMACLLRHAIDWITGSSNYLNFDMEEAFASPWDFTALLHSPYLDNPPKPEQTCDSETRCWHGGG